MSLTLLCRIFAFQAMESKSTALSTLLILTLPARLCYKTPLALEALIHSPPPTMTLTITG